MWSLEHKWKIRILALTKKKLWYKIVHYHFKKLQWMGWTESIKLKCKKIQEIEGTKDLMSESVQMLFNICLTFMLHWYPVQHDNSLRSAWFKAR